MSASPVGWPRLLSTAWILAAPTTISSLPVAQEVYGALQDIVTPVTNTRQRGVRLDVRHDADSLELAAVGVAHRLAGEVHHDPAWEDGACDTAVRATRVTAGCAPGRAKRDTTA